MIQAFVSGQLSDADHDLMAHHISTCQECAAAVAAERVVRAEMAKLSVSADTPPAPAAASGEPPAVDLPPALSADAVVPAVGQVADSGSAPVAGGADMLSGSVVQSGDLSLPPVPELQLDFILDRTSDGAGVLLHHETVREVALDQLPAAPAHSGRRSQREEETEAGAGIEIARAGYSDDTEVAAATMAGIADSVAHAAAALAGSGPPEPLEAEVQKPVTVEAAVIVPAAPAVGTGAGLLRWSAAAALLVVAVVAAYAATQRRSSLVANAAAPDRVEAVIDSELQWLTTPSVLTPILDSAVYSRVLDVTLVADSLADSLEAGIGYAPTAGEIIGDTTAPPAAAVGAQSTRRARAPDRLPQIVSDPPDIGSGQGRQQPGDILPEVVTGNAPARTTARGSAVVISGVPDTPRLLRTTTHRPRPDVAYVLREYDASAAEPAPRAGVNEYRWSDATGSRLYVLSGPVGVTELRAYARSFQTQGR